MYTKTLIAGWGDMDFNAHMRNTAYLDKSADVRMMYFADNGFPMSEFVRLKLGPVVMKDEIEYFRECRLLDAITVTFSMAGLSEDASRMMLRNEFFRDGVLCARVTSRRGGSIWRPASWRCHRRAWPRPCGRRHGPKTSGCWRAA